VEGVAVKLIIDARNLRLYPVGLSGFHGGTETYVKVLASGLAAKGHTVHIVTPDLDDDEQRGEREWWWGPNAHPSKAEAVVMVHSLAGADDYSGDALIYATNGVDPYLGPDGRLAELVAAFPVFSRKHGELMCAQNPTIDKSRCVVTGLGVDLDEYAAYNTLQLNKDGHAEGPVVPKVPGRIWVGNDPARGLWHVLDVFEIVQREMPEATLHITYDFDRQYEQHRWRQNILAETMRECRRRLKTIPGVVNLGSLDRPGVVREQLEAMVHLWPSDPPNVGSQIHGISQAEAAAAGCALVLSDTEAFPEVFGGVAEILPVPGRFIPDPNGDGRRVDAQDYADIVLDLLRDPELWAKASRASRKLAEQHTWAAVIDKWDQMLGMLSEQEAAA
jgi:glycosyltransferase involved in cell wall biosynthesis